jgi:branched-chain amino acid transport system ATP-binding protein
MMMPPELPHSISREVLIGLAPGTPALSIDGLVSGYGNMEVLHGIDLRLARGQSLCIIGPNGSGKSTILRSIYGLADIRAGQVIANGHDITWMRPSAKLQRSRIAYVRQESSVFPDMTVEQNLRLGGFLMQRSTQAAKAAEAVMDQYPILGKRRRHVASLLSGGERRLLEIARVMMMDPEILLLDEPSIGLSPISVEEIFELFAHLQHDLGKTLLIVEQNARKALEFADIAYVLTAGRLVLAGKGKDLLQDRRVGRLFLGGNPELVEIEQVL